MWPIAKNYQLYHYEYNKYCIHVWISMWCKIKLDLSNVKFEFASFYFFLFLILFLIFFSFSITKSLPWIHTWKIMIRRISVTCAVVWISASCIGVLIVGISILTPYIWSVVEISISMPCIGLVVGILILMSCVQLIEAISILMPCIQLVVGILILAPCIDISK